MSPIQAVTSGERTAPSSSSAQVKSTNKPVAHQRFRKGRGNRRSGAARRAIHSFSAPNGQRLCHVRGGQELRKNVSGRRA